MSLSTVFMQGMDALYGVGGYGHDRDLVLLALTLTRCPGQVKHFLGKHEGMSSDPQNP